MPAAPLLLGFEELLTALWLSLRVGGMWVAIPVFGSAVLPARLRVLLDVLRLLVRVGFLHRERPRGKEGAPPTYFLSHMASERLLGRLG